MGKNDEVLKMRDELKRMNEKQEDMICDLTTENAILKKDNNLLIDALKLKGDTEIIYYRGKCYKVVCRTLTDDIGNHETLDINCIIREETA